MSRPRSTDKHQPLTISMPGSLMKRLDQELSYKQSRSKWVQQAIKAKLDAHNDKEQVVANLSDLVLIQMLFARKIISLGLFDELYDKVSNNI